MRRLLAGGHEVTATARPGGDAWRLAEVASDVAVEEVDLADPAAAGDLVRRLRPD